MKYCPKCQQQFDSAQRLCPADGELLSHTDPYYLVGHILMEKYKIEALVGIGGMGAVYSARHLAINRQVAFKILQPNLALGNERMLNLFQREAETAGQLSHENIVNIYDAGRTPTGIAYIAMEWLEGWTLDDELILGRPLTFERTGAILHQVAAALDHAHARRIVHCDLKPSNIMLVTSGDGREQVKVVDFGIAKVISETSVSPISRVMGTPLYASPEQFSPGVRLDGRADIYSLGVVLYQMLTAHLPFYADAPLELMRMHKTDVPPSLRSYRHDLPVPIEQLVLRMLAKQPQFRPQTATEAAEVFEHAVKSPGTAKTPAAANLKTNPPGRSMTDVMSLHNGGNADLFAPTSVMDIHRPSDSSSTEIERIVAPLIQPNVVEPTIDKSEPIEPLSTDSKRPIVRRIVWPLIGAMIVLIVGALFYLKPVLPPQMPGPNPSPKPLRVKAMSYSLEITDGECGKGRRTTGDEPIRAGQFFKFHFIPRQHGYLYIIAPDAKNTPTTLLTGQPHPGTGVTTNFVQAGADYSFPGDGKCLGITKDETMMAFTVILSPSLLSTPGFLTTVANHPLTATEQNQLSAWREQIAPVAPEVIPNFDSGLSYVTTLQSDLLEANRPVVFNLKVKRQ